MQNSVKTTKSFTLAGARKIAATVVKKANEPGVSGAIAVVDESGGLIYFERLVGTMPAASQIAIGKAASAAAFRRPTVKIENLIQEQRQPMFVLGGITHTPHVPLMGAYPVAFNGEIVGNVAVAGAKTGENDEIIALEASKITLTH